jgi:DNA transposition AAA+ family ATPase
MPAITQLRALAPILPQRIVNTTTKRRIETSFEHAVDNRAAVAVTGAPGVGKTTALGAIAEQRALTAFVTVTPSNRRLKALMSMMCHAFGISTDAKFGTELASVLEYQLPAAAGNGWALIVDEVQLLDGDAIFQLVKYTELFGLPVVLSGNAHSLKRTRANASAIDQVRDRIGLWTTIDGVTEADLIEFCIEYNVEGRDARALIVEQGMKSSLRSTTRLLSEARVFAGPVGSIRRANIADALTLIHGAGVSTAGQQPKGTGTDG